MTIKPDTPKLHLDADTSRKTLLKALVERVDAVRCDR